MWCCVWTPCQYYRPTETQCVLLLQLPSSGPQAGQNKVFIEWNTVHVSTLRKRWRLRKHPKGIAFNPISFGLSYSSDQFVFRQHVWWAGERPSTKPISPSLEGERAMQVFANESGTVECLRRPSTSLPPAPFPLLLLLLHHQPHQREASDPLSSLTLERDSPRQRWDHPPHQTDS